MRNSNLKKISILKVFLVLMISVLISGTALGEGLSDNKEGAKELGLNEEFSFNVQGNPADQHQVYYFKFTPDNSDTYVFDLSGEGGYLEVLDGDTVSNRGKHLKKWLSEGNTYYFKFNGVDGDYSVCVRGKIEAVINGEISIPEGIEIPDSGLRVGVTATPENYYRDFDGPYITLTKDKRSTSYKIRLDEVFINDKIAVNYRIFDYYGDGNLGIKNIGYANDKEPVVLSGETLEGIDMVIQEREFKDSEEVELNQNIKGKLQNEEQKVFKFRAQKNNTHFFWMKYYYEVYIHIADSNGVFMDKYFYTDNENKIDLTPGEFYYVFIDCRRESTDDKNYNFRISDSIKGSVRGTVALKDGDNAPEGGVEFRVMMLNDNGESLAKTEVVIPQGQSSVDYTIEGDFNKNSDWILKCEAIEKSNVIRYFDTVYFNSNGTTKDIDDAEKMNFIESEDLEKDVNLLRREEVVTARTISLGEKVSNKFTNMEKKKYYKFTTGENESYSFFTDKNGLYSSLNIYDSEGFKRKVGTEFRVDFATNVDLTPNTTYLIEIGKMYKDFDFTIKETEVLEIKGKVYIPGNYDGTSESMNGNMMLYYSTAEKTDYSYLGSQSFTINKGENYGEFKFDLKGNKADTKFKIKYSMNSYHNKKYVSNGFYKDGLIVSLIGEASELTQDDFYSDIDMNLAIKDKAKNAGVIVIDQEVDVTFQNNEREKFYSFTPTENMEVKVHYDSDVNVRDYILDNQGFEVDGELKEGTEYYLYLDNYYESENSFSITFNEKAYNKISGRIYLPEGVVAPRGGLNTEFTLYDEHKWKVGTKVTTAIEEGQSYGEYVIQTKEDRPNRVYTCEYGTLPTDVEFRFSGKVEIDMNGSSSVQKDIHLENVHIAVDEDNAQVVELNNSISGYFGEEEDKDFVFIPEEDGLYIFTIRGANDAFLVDSNNEILSRDYRRENIYRYRLFSDLEKGKKYYLNLKKGSNSNSYDFTINKGGIIRGTIELPEGSDLYEDDIEFDVNAMTKGDWGHNTAGSTRVIIPKGIRSVEYSIPIPDNSMSEDIIIKYFCNYNRKRIFPYGYYGGEKTAFIIDRAEKLSFNNGEIMDGINFKLLESVLVKGEVIGYEGRAVDQEVSGQIQMEYEVKDHGFVMDVTVCGEDFSISEGDGKKEFIMYLPKTEDEEEYILSYTQYNDSYIRKGYYGVNETVMDKISSDRIRIRNTNIEGIELELIEPVYINGRVSLPNGEVAESGVELNIITEKNGKTAMREYVQIPEGENSADYRIAVRKNSGPYKVGCNYIRFYDEFQRYVESVYYSENGTVINEVDATGIYVEEEDKELDIELIKVRHLKGTFHLPQGVKFSEDVHLLMGISYFEERGGRIEILKRVKVKAGTDSVEFALPIDESYSEGVIQYSLRENNLPVVDEGYYSDEGTVFDRDKGKRIDLTKENEKVDFWAPGGLRVHINYNFPNGDNNDYTGLRGSMILENSDDNYSDFKTFFRVNGPNDPRRVTVKIPLDTENQKFNLKYNLNQSDRLVKKGYYGDNGETTLYKRDSRDFSITEDGLELDIEFIPESQITDEQGETRDEAELIEVNRDIYSSISRGGDIDWFKFELEEEQLVNISMIEGSCEWHVENSDGKVLDYNGFSGMLGVGTYYIKVKAFFMTDETYGYIMNISAETKAQNALTLKVRDMGEEPRVTAVVSDGNRNEEIESSINKDGEYYLMELSGFKWNSGEQNIWIQNGDSILNTVVSAQDKGKTVEVGADDEYTLNSVVLNASGKTMVTTFYYKVIQGREVYVGRSYSTVRLPKGNYNILSDFKVGEGDQKDRYILFRDDCEISQKESSVEFNTEDLVKVTARYINNTREEMKAGDMTLLKRGFGVNVSFDQALKGIYVCKGSYGSIKYTAQFGDFEYVYRKKNLDIYKDSDLYLDSDIRIDHNFRDFVFTKGSRLTGWVDFELGRYIRLFKLVDGSGNYISSIKNTESGSDEYHFNIKIENDEVSNTYYEDCDSYERITLPEIKGVYDLTAEVREGALPIAPLKVKIRICDEQVHEFYDFNGSGKPDKGDLRVLEENLNKKAADGIFDKMDINLDGIIDIYDIIRMTKRFNIGF